MYLYAGICACVFHALRTRKPRWGCLSSYNFCSILALLSSEGDTCRKRKAKCFLSFLRHLTISFNPRKCFPSSEQLKHPTALETFLLYFSSHILLCPSPTESEAQMHPGLYLPAMGLEEDKNWDSFFHVLTSYSSIPFHHRESVSKEFWSSDLNGRLEPSMGVAFPSLPNSPE